MRARASGWPPMHAAWTPGTVWRRITASPIALATAGGAWCAGVLRPQSIYLRCGRACAWLLLNTATILPGACSRRFLATGRHGKLYGRREMCCFFACVLALCPNGRRCRSWCAKAVLYPQHSMRPQACCRWEGTLGWPSCSLCLFSRHEPQAKAMQGARSRGEWWVPKASLLLCMHTFDKQGHNYVDGPLHVL